VIAFAEALRLVLDEAAPITRIETVPLAHADGRVVACDVVAASEVPPFDRAAMDGYAVIASDTAGVSAATPRRFHLAQRIYTGDAPSTQLVSPGECVAVATGAPMPPGADAVVIVEETSRDGDAVTIRTSVTPRQNVGARAADIARGTTFLRAGDILSPARLGALAATGHVQVDVYARPTVAIVSTGNEIVAPGAPLGHGQIYDINRVTLSAAVERHGGLAMPLSSADDRLGDLAASLNRALAEDVVVFSGGSSVGERDLVKDLLRERGRVIFHGIAVKPGKPTAFAVVDGKPVFGMPGYPTSCLSNAYMLLAPFLRKVARLQPWTPRTIDAPLSRRVASVADRHQFYTVRIEGGKAEPAFKASGDITSLANADGYIEIEAGVSSVEAGQTVKVTLF